SGIKKKCKYPAFFANHFKEIIGKFENVWVTCYELEQALKYKEVKIEKIYGYIMYPKTKEKSSLQEYVKTFIELKNNTSKEDTNYEFYKRLLNALYGKFIQMREEKLDDGSSKWITGLMFQPFIASLITGFVRAYIHDLEHRFKSIHTSTDSIKTLNSIPKKYLSKKLGGLSLEVKGKCLLIRNRLYLHYDENGELKKYALHGFKGKPEGLLKLWNKKEKYYSANRMIKPKEAIIQGKNPFVFETQKRILNY
ncbi:MAG TPA: DNA polymerase, partial [Candidatus Lokiarchaeia archaeon]